MPEGHFRVVSTLKNGKKLIQQPHFKSTDDADVWIALHAHVIIPGETVDVIPDSDSRVYPFWRQR